MAWDGGWADAVATLLVYQAMWVSLQQTAWAVSKDPAADPRHHAKFVRQRCRR